MTDKTHAEKQLAFDMNLIAKLGGGIVAVWIFVALLPFLSLKVFPSVESDTQERLKTVLGQWGTFGDLFNCLNVFFSGGALIGVVYTVILQRREMHQQQEQLAAEKAERDRTQRESHQILLLNALSQLAQVQAQQYSAKADEHDKTHLKYLHVREQGHDVHPEHTVKGMLLEYKEEMLAILQKIRESGPK